MVPHGEGELGDKGGREFTKIPSVVRMAGPKVVFIEKGGLRLLNTEFMVQDNRGIANFTD